MRNLLIIQAALVLAAMLGAYLLGGGRAVAAAGYGGTLALTNSLLLAWRVGRAGRLAGEDRGRSTLTLYFGAVERFMVALAGFALGMGLLHLAPGPLLAGFACAELGYWLAGQRSIGTG